jgi:tripartite motif-containing protein 2/3
VLVIAESFDPNVSSIAFSDTDCDAVSDQIITTTTGVAFDMQQQPCSLCECPICKDTYSDPRSLPCIHTFCLECVKGFSRDKLPGDGVACPLCRTEFTVPDNGIESLPKNFFVQQLRDLAGTVISHCEESGGTDNNESSRQPVKNCENHLDRVVELFCFDCQSAICVECLVQSHRSHEYSFLSEVIDEFRKQMTADVQHMEEAVAACDDMLNLQEERKKNFISEVDGVEKQICDQAEQLKMIIESAKCELLQDLGLRKQERVKQIQHVIDDIEQRKSFIGSLIKYTEELRDKGTVGDVTQQSIAIHNRADELIKLNNILREINGLGSSEAKFKAAKKPVNAGNSLIGHVYWQLVEGK